jgi:putative ABC transport system permease protein
LNSAKRFLAMALQAIVRNSAQTLLAVLGVMIGVGALVTSIALGRGAQSSIEDQLLAAGANMIVVTAGNYQVERQQRGGGGIQADHGSITLPDDGSLLVAAARRPATPADFLRPAVLYQNDLRLMIMLDRYGIDSRLQYTHFEDDPMAVHDHPTAKERLGDAMAGLGSAATLTLDDAETIRREISGVQFVASGVHENARISINGETGKQWFTRLHGTESQLPVIRRGWTFPYGSFLTKSQVEDAEQVMVIGRVVADRLFGAGVNPVGETVFLWNQPFEISGVVDSTSWAAQPAAGDDQFDAVYVPVTTVHKLLNLSKLNTITVTAASAGDTSTIAEAIKLLLRERHGITEEMADDFTVRTQAEQVLGKGLSPGLARTIAGNLASIDELTIDQLSASLQRANRTMLALLAGVATVSLLVGGIGVMNLLLLSVTQRTREVGLRMALGARRRDIASQFLTEATLISIIGGILGAIAGIIAATSLEGLFSWTTDISPLSMLLAIVVAALVGMISGVYPAYRASRLDPLKALHYE